MGQSSVFSLIDIHLPLLAACMIVPTFLLVNLAKYVPHCQGNGVTQHALPNGISSIQKGPNIWVKHSPRS